MDILRVYKSVKVLRWNGWVPFLEFVHQNYGVLSLESVY